MVHRPALVIPVGGSSGAELIVSSTFTKTTLLLPVLNSSYQLEELRPRLR
jgi:hypothetical protein